MVLGMPNIIIIKQIYFTHNSNTILDQRGLMSNGNEESSSILVSLQFAVICHVQDTLRCLFFWWGGDRKDRTSLQGGKVLPLPKKSSLDTVA